MLRTPQLFPVEELARVLHAERQGPIRSAPYFLDEKYTTSGGYCSRVEVRPFPRLSPPKTRPLEVSAERCLTAQRAPESCFHLPAHHSAYIVGSIGGALYSAMVVGEMYWRHLAPPRTALHVVRDWVLDIGVKSRPRRRGVFDSDFAHFWPAGALRGDGTCFFFAHFAKLHSARLGSRWPRVGMSEYSRPTPNVIDLFPGELDNTPQANAGGRPPLNTY